MQRNAKHVSLIKWLFYERWYVALACSGALSLGAAWSLLVHIHHKTIYIRGLQRELYYLETSDTKRELRAVTAERNHYMMILKGRLSAESWEYTRDVARSLGSKERANK